MVEFLINYHYCGHLIACVVVVVINMKMFLGEGTRRALLQKTRDLFFPLV